ncbi:branched-chain amino acid ABC transporter permease, partial [Rhizobiaceae sp. 2RAB30]
LLRWRAFIVAAFFAGIGGALWGHFITSFSPKAFYLKETFLILSMLVIGGANTVTGAVVGTFIVTIAYEALRGLEGVLNEAKISTEPVIGLTEIVLS